MIGSNSSNVLKALDGIRERRHKFVCLNDNMNHSDPDVVKVQKIISDFYHSLFPFPSEMELSPQNSNKYLYIDEIREGEKKIREEEQRLLNIQREEENIKKQLTLAAIKQAQEIEKIE